MSSLQEAIERGTLYNQNKLKPGRPAINSNNGMTLEAIAKKYGVAEKTVFNDGKFVEALDRIAEVDPEFESAVRSGEAKAPRYALVKIAGLESDEEIRRAIEKLQGDDTSTHLDNLEESKQAVTQLRESMQEACRRHIDLQISTFQPALDELDRLISSAIKRTS